MFSLYESTYFLLWYHRYSSLKPDDYIDWAVQLLENGYDSINIRILAGLDFADTEEKMLYFDKSLNDLNIEIPEEQSEFLDSFTKILAKRVINKLKDPHEGLSIMHDILRETDYSRKYIQFMNLDDDIDYIYRSTIPIEENSENNIKICNMIINEFKLFLECESLKINLNDKSFCKNCKIVSEPKLKNKKSFFKSGRYSYYCCPCCGSEDLIHGSSQEGKDIILETIQIKKN